MRMMFFIYSLRGGGAERVMANLANCWAAAGREVSIVSILQIREDEYELHPNIKRISLNLATEANNAWTGLVWNYRRVMALRELIRKIQPDVAVAFMTTANILLGLATLGLPQVIAIGTEHIHPPMLYLGRIWEALRRMTYGNLAAVTALSGESAAWLRANTNAKRVPVITNMAMWPLPVQDPVIAPGQVVTEDRHLLIAAGRLNPQKGYDLLIEAFAALAAKHGKWDLVILGEGTERAALEHQIRSGGLQSRVKLIGHAGNLRDWYERADIFVLSSRHEGYPGVLTEALVHGLPAISFDCDTGPRDIIRHEVDGLLVPNGDVKALSSAIERLIEEPALRNRFKAESLAARERFSIERIVSTWEALFTELGVAAR